MSTIFSKIISWEINSYKIYEDEYVFAFLDTTPHSLWHTLLIPKKEVDYFVDLPEPDYSHLFQVAKKVAKAIHIATWCKRVWTVIAWRDVPHMHYHLIPMHHYDDLDHSKRHKESEEDMHAVQEKIINLLNS